MGLNLLVVDDSEITRIYISQAAQASGAEINEIFEAEDGIEGMALLHDQKIDVLFLDINMPGMDGLEVIQQIKQDIRYADTLYVIVITVGMEFQIEEAKRMGVDIVLEKPIQKEKIQELLEKIYQTKHVK